MKIKGYFFSVIASFFACQNEEVKPITSHHSAMDSIYQIVSNWYYWNDNLPLASELNVSGYVTPYELMMDVRMFSPFNPRINTFTDQWSFAMSKEDWGNIASGVSGDFGAGFKFFSSDDLRISWVQPYSSAGLASLKRGDRVITINNIEAHISNLEAIVREIAMKRELHIVIRKGIGDIVGEVVLEKFSYPFTPVGDVNIFTNASGKKVGYIHIYSFTGSVADMVRNSLQEFKKEDIHELIIDLRYNGGGFMLPMEKIADMLIPAHQVGNIMYHTIHSSVNSIFNERVYFNNSSYRVDIDKLYFITSSRTASSSEIFINSLSPYLNVETIGQPTQGKLMGMYTIPVNNYIVSPVSFLVTNVNKEGDEFSVIKPDRLVVEDVSSPFNESEACIRAALSLEEDMPPAGRITRREGMYIGNMYSAGAFKELRSIGRP